MVGPVQEQIGEYIFFRNIIQINDRAGTAEKEMIADAKQQEKGSQNADLV